MLEDNGNSELSVPVVRSVRKHSDFQFILTHSEHIVRNGSSEYCFPSPCVVRQVKLCATVIRCMKYGEQACSSHPRLKDPESI